jgi:hypothetical protein
MQVAQNAKKNHKLFYQQAITIAGARLKWHAPAREIMLMSSAYIMMK